MTQNASIEVIIVVFLLIIIYYRLKYPHKDYHHNTNDDGW